MANKWHSIDRRIYGEGDGPAHFAEASNAAQAEQIVREHNERDAMRDALEMYAVNMSYDCPGDVPIQCGLWCCLCKEHIDNGAPDHKATCLLYAPEARAASQGQKRKG